MKITVIKELNEWKGNQDEYREKQRKYKQLTKVQGYTGWDDFTESDIYYDAYRAWKQTMKTNGVKEVAEKDFYIQPECEIAYEEWREANDIKARTSRFDIDDINNEADEDEESISDKEFAITQHKYNRDKFLAIVSELIDRYGWQDKEHYYKPTTWNLAADIMCQMDGAYDTPLYLNADKFWACLSENEDWVKETLKRFNEVKSGEWGIYQSLYRNMRKVAPLTTLYNDHIKAAAQIMSPSTQNFIMSRKLDTGTFNDEFFNVFETKPIAQYGAAENNYTASYYPPSANGTEGYPTGTEITITPDIVRYYNWAWNSVGNFWYRPLYMRDSETGCCIACGISGKEDYEFKIKENIQSGKHMTITAKISKKALGKQTGRTYITWLNGWKNITWH